MKSAKVNKDSAPGIGATGAGAQEERECGPVDQSYIPEKHVAERLRKQGFPVDLNRIGENGDRENLNHCTPMRDCGPLYKGKK